MKHSCRAAITLLTVMLCTRQGVSQSPYVQVGSHADLKIGGDILMPAADEDWDLSAGASGRLILWSPENPHLGLALAVGGQSWQVNEDVFADGDWDYGFTGDATMIPLGLSLAGRFPLGIGTWLTIEGGFRYVFVDSSVQFVSTEFTPAGQPLATWVQEVDIDDGVIALVGAEIEIPIGIGIGLYAGAGYQFDVSKGKTYLDGVSLGHKNSLEAFVISAGLKLEF